MGEFTLPDQNKYIRYSAYVRLKHEVIRRCEKDGCLCFASVLFKSIILDSADVIIRKCADVNITIDDNVKTVIEKHFTMQSLEHFKCYVTEAAAEFIKEISLIEGPTISEIDAATDKVIQMVFTELITI